MLQLLQSVECGCSILHSSNIPLLSDFFFFFFCIICPPVLYCEISVDHCYPAILFFLGLCLFHEQWNSRSAFPFGDMRCAPHSPLYRRSNCRPPHSARFPVCTRPIIPREQWQLSTVRLLILFINQGDELVVEMAGMKRSRRMSIIYGLIFFYSIFSNSSTVKW